MKISRSYVSILPLVFLGLTAGSWREISAPGAATVSLQNSPQVTRIAPLFPVQAPGADSLWTSTREIRALQIAPGGVWAATSGGVLHFNGKTWAKWTRKTGLPFNEALGIGLSKGAVQIRFPTALATRNSAGWNSETAPVFTPIPQKIRWENRVLSLSAGELKWGNASIALPPDSVGTHFSAIAVQNSGKLLAAIYGDGLWQFDGAHWSHTFGVPFEAREITAMAGEGARTLWIGTRRAGIFRREAGKWTPFLQDDEPLSHNIQALAIFQNVLWASTLDDGLVAQTGAGWKHFSAPILSSSAPRQMLIWNEKLWVRHGGGSVDSFDGRAWTKGDLATVPRPGIYALAGDNERLYAAGWGGWSEWNGAMWTAHFDIGELKGVPVLGLLPDGEFLWIATQSRGLGRWNRRNGKFRWFDERDGLSDDWVTTLAKIDGKIYAGTFVGGLARLDGEKWHVFPEMRGLNVTAIEKDGQGGALVATRSGLWRIRGEAAEKVETEWLDSEDQALLATPTGTWIGARTSLSFLTEH